jgi:hypothetical protein
MSLSRTDLVFLPVDILAEMKVSKKVGKKIPLQTNKNGCATIHQAVERLQICGHHHDPPILNMPLFPAHR